MYAFQRNLALKPDNKKGGVGVLRHISRLILFCSEVSTVWKQY